MRPLLHAEQALLGAVLLDPGQLDHLDWLEPEHFYRPAHQALFAALRHMRAQGQPALAADGTVPPEWVSDAVAEAGQHTRGLTMVYAHVLVSACPRPEHAPVYGRMVLEGAIHRTVTEHAVRLHQIARADAVRGEADNTLHHADVLAAVLEDLARRWGTGPRPASPAPTLLVPASPAPAEAGTVADNEQLLLAALTERPTGMEEVVGWLRPQDFADRAHGELYRCLGALHHRGEPIDQITLLWEAQRRGLLTDGTVTGEQITAICDGIGPGSAQWLGEEIARSSVLRTAAATAHTIRDLAASDAVAPGQLINQALAALGVLDDVRQRWATGTHAPAPAPAGGEPAAGPPAAQIRAARARSTPSSPSHQPAPAGSSVARAARTPARSRP
ncbi:DnaB-like helicase N-terminal domain-containing protein [Actinacidiphila guanduensis]|uniref:DnaB-like helicase N terminal domain-containing protein n=1 Tax=Actinacidiphila guanduensis TaxID=310781 RepID=A0A1H0SGH2_9ACTN|nr:DnaB-like helicase N-terminal domain-containing protein [Actinacidiphila guanduensis]SDP40843.1 DnaB-like helicase N terminal domain-containing protein [Actinacidiphila guanduensis]